MTSLFLIDLSGLIRSITLKLGAPQRVRLLAYAKYAVYGLGYKPTSEPGNFVWEVSKYLYNFIKNEAIDFGSAVSRFCWEVGNLQICNVNELPSVTSYSR